MVAILIATFPPSVDYYGSTFKGFTFIFSGSQYKIDYFRLVIELAASCGILWILFYVVHPLFNDSYKKYKGNSESQNESEETNDSNEVDKIEVVKSGEGGFVGFGLSLLFIYLLIKAAYMLGRH